MDLLIDTNVLIDVIAHRDEFFDESKAIYDSCINKTHNGYIAAHTITNMNYILRKVFSDGKRRQILFALCDVFTVVDLDSEKIISALERSNFPDFEDCLQDECAIDINADYIITRNKEDYEASKIKALTPGEFVRLYK